MVAPWRTLNVNYYVMCLYIVTLIRSVCVKGNREIGDYKKNNQTFHESNSTSGALGGSTQQIGGYITGVQREGRGRASV